MVLFQSKNMLVKKILKLLISNIYTNIPITLYSSLKYKIKYLSIHLFNIYYLIFTILLLSVLLSVMISPNSISPKCKIAAKMQYIEFTSSSLKPTCSKAFFSKLISIKNSNLFCFVILTIRWKITMHLSIVIDSCSCISKCFHNRVTGFSFPGTAFTTDHYRLIGLFVKHKLIRRIGNREYVRWICRSHLIAVFLLFLYKTHIIYFFHTSCLHDYAIPLTDCLVLLSRQRSCMSMVVVGRCSKSLIRHLDTKCVNLGASGRADNGKTGGGSRALIGCNPLSGGSPVANSMAVMPNDHTSHRLSVILLSLNTHYFKIYLIKIKQHFLKIIFLIVNMFIVYKEIVVHKSEILLQIISLTRLRRSLLIKSKMLYGYTDSVNKYSNNPYKNIAFLFLFSSLTRLPHIIQQTFYFYFLSKFTNINYIKYNLLHHTCICTANKSSHLASLVLLLEYIDPLKKSINLQHCQWSIRINVKILSVLISVTVEHSLLTPNQLFPITPTYLNICSTYLNRMPYIGLQNYNLFIHMAIILLYFLHGILLVTTGTHTYDNFENSDQKKSQIYATIILYQTSVYMKYKYRYNLDTHGRIHQRNNRHYKIVVLRTRPTYLLCGKRPRIFLFDFRGNFGC
ncbi:hypothetical protein AGLY_003187 [Aphis glycines]|uniref:Uncharacterized protein n=1 Tax=Aphis glycines TaxID=307491 RepID=A0A6G0U4X5_APHGL|nr:hypothetical protein AGLY_003187 [Aphis glycines]